jgi:hypothetical protein
MEKNKGRPMGDEVNASLRMDLTSRQLDYNEQKEYKR